MAGKIYVVKVGKKPGIYHTWDDCKAQVHGFPGAIYKSFKTMQEAQSYIGGASESVTAKPVISSPKSSISLEDVNGVIAYVDGSYNQVSKEFSYGMIVLRDGKEYKYAKSYHDPDLATMRNVAGEIKGSEAAMRYAIDQELSQITIFHDYEGIARWCLGDWKTNKEGTKAYKAFYDSIKEKVRIRFVKVTGHSNDTYNDIADELAKQAVGLIEPIHTLESIQY